MKGCRPLSKEEARLLKDFFLGRLAKRNYALFVLGASTGFRISELLSLTIGDLVDVGGHFKERITVSRKNMKGQKSSRSNLLNQEACRSLTPWLRQLSEMGFDRKSDYVFQSYSNTNKAITRKHAWRIFINAFRLGQFPGSLGTHTMRKTYAKHVYQFYLNQVAQGESVDAFRATSKALGHIDIKSTDQYLSFLTEEIDAAVNSLEIF
ncbi:MAG: integrase [Desulforhopalus sp.]|jgi:integrase